MNIIHQTTNYSQFKVFDRNRDTCIAALLQSVIKKNMLSSHPILVTKKLEIVDGQHRLLVAKELNVPIYFIIDDSVSIEDVPQCQIQRAWSLPDYLKFYLKSDNEAYKFVKKMSLAYPQYKVHTLAYNFSASEAAWKQFRNGKYKLSHDEEYLEERMDIFHQIVMKSNEVTCRQMPSIHFLRAIWLFIVDENFDMKYFLSRIDKYPNQIMICNNLNTVRLIVEQIKKKLYSKDISVELKHL